jgi:hypothetical protein
MAFNDLRKGAARDVRDAFAEAAVYQPAAGGDPIATRLIVHRARAVMDTRPSQQMKREHLDQAMTSVTVFRLGEDGDIANPKRDDTVTLTGTSEVFKIGSKVLLHDEFKTRVVATPVLS